MYLVMLLMLMQRPVTRSEHPIKSAAVIEVPNLTVWRQDRFGRCFEVGLDNQKTLGQTIPCEPRGKKEIN
ncbi:MAG: hypothetical protein DMG70_22915 [Acidobacteria bacterium]|nr:MAG: hypothetical protein DMG70_22915 [Acidobacteriota bacterium]PYY08096.1 MAG: hypothetical protein DMG69_16220 [Acidobacteriota bacterium]